MKKAVIAVVMFAMASLAAAQSVDSLKKLLALSQPDTNRVLILSKLSISNVQSDHKAAIGYAEQGLALARKLGFKKGEADCLRRSGLALFIVGNYPEALDRFQQALIIGEEIKYDFAIAAALGHIGNVYREQGDPVRAMSYYRRYHRIAQNMQDKYEIGNSLTRMGHIYLIRGDLDSAEISFNNAYSVLTQEGFFYDMLMNELGKLHTAKGNDRQAMSYFRQGYIIADSNNSYNILSEICVGMGNLFRRAGNNDSSIFYGLKGLEAAKKNDYSKGILAASKLLAESYEQVDTREAYKYQKLAMTINDTLFTKERSTEVQNLFSLEQQRLQSIETAKTNYRNQLRSYLLISGLGVFLLIALLLYRNNRAKQKANTLLQAQKQEIQLQRNNAEKALEDLKAAQVQLIQSEKMASLGELTAGIAHEIQNPLNFVNNFSEVNRELINEMNEDLAKGKIDEARSITKDIAENEEKILFHGKRAESIVKGMLQHSRSGSGSKELTDINALANDYLQLAFHGMRAKIPANPADKPVNAELKTDFDNSIQRINIVPEDIGRVLLNLYSNAFYAVNEKRKLIGEDFRPVIEVSTRKINNKVSISVKDNGLGIPENIKEKIFQPFFTTKPAGSGTGLGLSLSYDIIKAHNGEFSVNSLEGEGTEFTILLSGE